MESSVLSEVRFDVHRAITEKIVQAIEAGAGEFVMPWHRSGVSIGRPTNASTGVGYRGVNVVALWAEAMVSGYASGHWATFRQWQALGASVRKGQHGSTIVFYKRLEPRERSADQEQQEPRLIARASRVFNADQVTGWREPEPEARPQAETLPAVEVFVRATGATIIEGGDSAHYNHQADRVHLPDRHRFHGTPTSSPTESFYATLLHELTHWTGASHRLDRTFGQRYGDNAYAFEELVAELGAAFSCGDLGIANDPRPDHAAYVASWLKVLKDDRRAIFTAAKLASAAAEYLANSNAPS